MLEYIRPEIRQYFVADNVEERPFNQEGLNLVYRREQNIADTMPFGTEVDIWDTIIRKNFDQPIYLDATIRS